MRLLVKEVWFFRSYWMFARVKGKIIILDYLFIIYKVYFFFVFIMVNKGLILVSSGGVFFIGVWSFFRIF